MCDGPAGVQGAVDAEASGGTFSQRHLGSWLRQGQWTASKGNDAHAELEAIRTDEARQLPLLKISILVAMFMGGPYCTVLFLLLRDFENLCPCCHIHGWVLLLVLQLLAALV